MPFNRIFSPPLYKRTVCYIHFLHTIRVIALFKNIEHDFAKNETSHHCFVQTFQVCSESIQMYVAFTVPHGLDLPQFPSFTWHLPPHIVFLPGHPAAFTVCPSVRPPPGLCSVAYTPLQAPVCFSEGALLPVSELWYHREAWNTLSHPF